MKSTNNKVIIFGLDGCNWKILSPAIEREYMPFLKSLTENGSSGILKSTIPAITPAAWGSFLTGVNPEKNNVFNFSYWDKKTRESHFVDSTHLQKTFAQIASVAGKKVSLLNVPMTFPPQEINGVVVSGILTPSTESEFTFPKEFKKELLKNIPEYHIFNLNNASSGSPFFNPKDFITQILKIAKMRERLAKLVLEKQPHDIFMLHFQCCDVVQHALWPFLDENHEMYDSETHDFILKEFYGFIDKQMTLIQQDFCRINGVDTLTLVASDHGFETHRKRANIGNWLEKEGYLYKSKRKPVNPLKSITKKLRVGTTLKKFFNEKLICSIENKTGFSSDSFDWEKSYAFSIGRSGEGAIYFVNEENDARTSKLINDLSNLVDPETDKKVCKKILTRENLYGKHASNIFPDLTIIPAQGYSFTGSPQRNGDIFVNVTPEKDFHLGKHHSDGIWLASENLILNSNAEKHITDIASIILKRMDLTPTQQNSPSKSITNSNNNNSEIQKRLSDLGYM